MLYAINLKTKTVTNIETLPQNDYYNFVADPINHRLFLSNWPNKLLVLSSTDQLLKQYTVPSLTGFQFGEIMASTDKYLLLNIENQLSAYDFETQQLHKLINSSNLGDSLVSQIVGNFLVVVTTDACEMECDQVETRLMLFSKDNFELQLNVLVNDPEFSTYTGAVFMGKDLSEIYLVTEKKVLQYDAQNKSFIFLPSC